MANFSIDGIADTIGAQTAQTETELADFLTTMNPDSSADLILLQQRLQEWSLLTNLQSTTVKTLKDALSGIVQKMQ